MRQHWTLPGVEKLKYTRKDWLLLLLDSSPKEQRDLILLLMWRSWNVHNNITHAAGPTAVSDVVGFLLNMQENLSSSREVD